MGVHKKIKKRKQKMKSEKVIKENLSRIASDPNNFGWAPLAWAYTDD
jgi:hypothetical protein